MSDGEESEETAAPRRDTVRTPDGVCVVNRVSGGKEVSRVDRLDSG